MVLAARAVPTAYIPRHARERVPDRRPQKVLATGALAVGVSVAGLALPTTSAEAAIPIPAAAKAYPRLHVGSTGSAVSYVQRRLSVGATTGYFGVKTRRAVNSYKARHHWNVDGIVGWRVWRGLGVPKSSATYSRPASVSTSSGSSSRALRALAFARAQIGDRWVFAGTGPNTWDCSGLTMMAWRSVGVSLPHSAHLQYRAVSHKVSRSQLRPGDLVFWYSTMHHVGIYAGNGMAIDAPNPRTRVRLTHVSYMPYAGAVRPG